MQPAVNLSMSVVGVLHTLACVAALGLGAWLTVARKGTPRHRKLGDGYVAAIVFASLTSLTIYTRHAFTAAHWFAIMALATSLGGFALGRWHGAGQAWKYGHLTCMLLSYYVLVGGGVNEVFLRVRPLRPIFFHRPQVVGQTHALVMLAFVLLIVAFMLATAISGWHLRRRQRTRLQAAGSAA